MKRALLLLAIVGVAWWLAGPALGSMAHGLWAGLQATLGASLQLVLAAGFMLLLWRSATFRAITWGVIRVALVMVSIGLLAGALFSRYQDDDDDDLLTAALLLDD